MSARFAYWVPTGSDGRLRNEEGGPADNQGERTNRAFSLPWRALMAENELLTPSEVAVMFRVNPKTVTRWARAGKISAIRTLGGHRRFRASEIRKFLEQVDEANELE